MLKIIYFTKLFKLLGLVSLVALFYYSLMYSNIIWLLCSFVYYKIIVGLLGNQIAQHRYLSHNSFKTTNRKHKFLVWSSLTTGINPVLYAGIHRHHHIHSDSVKDLHSPSVSILNSVFTWSSDIKIAAKVRPAFDLLRNKHVLEIHRNGFYYLSIITFLLFLINWKLSVFILLAGIGWNYLHMNIIRTTLVHMKIYGSYRNFETNDNSWNNKFLQAIDIGEGLHNNHHKYPNRYNQAINADEFDPAAFVINRFLKV